MVKRARRNGPKPTGRTQQGLLRRTQRSNVIGAWVREARLSHAPPLTLEDLSAALEALEVTLTPASLSRIENGKRGVYDYEVIAFAKVFQQSTDTVLGVTGP